MVEYEFFEDSLLGIIGNYVYNLLSTIFHEKRKHKFTSGLNFILKWFFVLIFWGALIFSLGYGLFFYDHKVWVWSGLGFWVFVEVCIFIGYKRK